MVIVTKNQYLLAVRINHIHMDERLEHNDIRGNNGRFRTIINRNYVITIHYIPEATSSGNGFTSNQEHVRECSVVLRGAENAHQVFNDLIRQIREQMPDQLYLDKALERLLDGTDIDALKQIDYKDLSHDAKGMHDGNTKAVRKVGKAKRRSKKVLRKPKPGNRKRKG